MCQFFVVQVSDVTHGRLDLKFLRKKETTKNKCSHCLNAWILLLPQRLSISARCTFSRLAARLQYDLDGKKMEKKPSVVNRSRAHLMSVMERRLGVYPGLEKL